MLVQVNPPVIRLSGSEGLRAKGIDRHFPEDIGSSHGFHRPPGRVEHLNYQFPWSVGMQRHLHKFAASVPEGYCHPSRLPHFNDIRGFHLPHKIVLFGKMHRIRRRASDSRFTCATGCGRKSRDQYNPDEAYAYSWSTHVVPPAAAVQAHAQCASFFDARYSWYSPYH